MMTKAIIALLTLMLVQALLACSEDVAGSQAEYSSADSSTAASETLLPELIDIGSPRYRKRV